MADDVREYLRAAQAAEIRGDKAAAIALLLKAAAEYRATGRQGRAIQMLRHAHRLDSSRVELLEEIRRMEWLPDSASLSRVAESSLEESERALESLDTLESLATSVATRPARERRNPHEEQAPPVELPEVADPSRAELLVERGPRWAPEDADAWCSFCCRPKRETGRLVAGAAGAFICRGCAGFAESGGVAAQGSVPEVKSGGSTAATTEHPVVDSGRTATGTTEHSVVERGVSSVAAERGHVAPVQGAESDAPASKPLVSTFIGASVRERLPLLQAFRHVLILGVEGSGKSTLLRELAGVRGLTPRPITNAPAGAPLFIEDAQTLTTVESSWLLSQTDRAWTITLQGNAPEPSFTLVRDAVSLPVFSSDALVEASDGKLALALAEAVQLTLPLPVPDAALLQEIAKSALPDRSSDPSVLGALAAEADRSPRKGHELAALIARLPPGEWTLVAAEPPKARRRPGKKKGDTP